MEIITHIITFAAAIAAIWFFAGLIIESVDKVSMVLKKSAFIVGFFLLGFLTSLSEVSVSLNSMIQGVPQVSAGNLVGASFVLLIFIIPLLAVVTGRIQMNKIFDGRKLAYVLFVIAIPSLFLIDGSLTKTEGVAALIFLGILLWIISKSNINPPIEEQKAEAREANKQSPFFDVTKIIISAVVIFFSGNLLVSEAVWFADVLSIPQALVGMMILSVGTNIPEIAIAIRSVGKNRADVALGNYLGSAIMDTVAFSVLAIVSGTFSLEQGPIFIASFFTVVGFILFYIFIRSKNQMSRKEGLVLLALYIIFLIVNIYEVTI